jgi:uncharacterized protein YdaU (DUF1376 family)
MRDPAVLFYTGDFLNGCSDLTFEERGQYITLLCLQHQKGRLSEKTIRLSVGSVSVDVLSKFVKDDEGCYYNQRMDEEIEKRRQFIETRRNNGKKGGRPQKANAIPVALANEKLIENEDVNGNIIKIDYEFIINIYHNLCPNMAKVEKLTDQRKGFIRARFAEYGIEKITTVLRTAGESEFLNGHNEKVWKADFEWLMRPNNFIKVLEGKYHNRTKADVMP